MPEYTQPVVAIKEYDIAHFESRCAVVIEDGYSMSSSSCCVDPDNNDVYQAIFVNKGFVLNE